MFHVADNLYFQRLEDGSVRVVQYPPDARAVGIDKTGAVAFPDGVTPIFEATIAPAAWASVVASVSKGGEEAGRFYVAQAFHEGIAPNAAFSNFAADYPGAWRVPNAG